MSLTSWAQRHDFQEGQFFYAINRDRPNEVWVASSSSYSSLSGEVVIPSTVTHGNETYTVTGIDDYAFKYCSEITSFSIPSSIINIGWDAFAETSFFNDASNWVDNALYLNDCLIAIKPELSGNYQIKEGTRVIVMGAFYNCTSLTSVTIPSSVISIGTKAFADCSALTTVNIPSSVKYIGENPFEETALYNDPSNWVDNVLYVDNCLISAKDVSGTYNVAKGTRMIADKAFSYYNEPLTSVTIPSSVTYIGQDAFYSCRNLTDIQVESANPAYVSENGILYNADKTVLLHYPTAKTEETLTLLPSVRSFSNNAFYLCDNLTTIEWNAVNFLDFSNLTNYPDWRYVDTLIFGDGVEHIPANLCHNISSHILSITISSTVTSIGQDAFAGCGNLYTYKNYSTQSLYFLLKNSANLRELVCPSEDFAPLTFEDISSCNGLKSLTVHSLYYGVYDLIFSFAALQQNTLTYLDIETIWTDSKRIPDKLFCDFMLLETVKLPKDLVYTGSRTFENCRMLQEITIPATVLEIDDSAFENCRSLSAVNFGNAAEGQTDDASQCALQRIGKWAFYNCHQLQKIAIPEGVTEIDDAAFYGCSYLEDIVLPSSLQTIGDNCFSLCSKVGRIIVNATTPPAVEAKTFYEVNRSIPVYVPKGSLEAYKANPYWSEFRLLDEDPASVDAPTADNSGCYAANGMLYNPNAAEISVYNMQGVQIYSGNAPEVKMPSKGIYILKTPTSSEKVVL